MATQRRHHQFLAGAGIGLVDQVLEQVGAQRILLVRRRIDMRAFAFVADQQALAVHDLQQPQHGGVGQVRALALGDLVHLLGGGGAERPQHAQQVQFGRGGLGRGGFAGHVHPMRVGDGRKPRPYRTNCLEQIVYD
nr:hypothetical protein [Arenimonas daejeonensis]